MGFTPVFDRELRVLARSKRTHHVRLLSAGCAFGLFWWMTYLTRFGVVRGPQIFQVLSGFAFILCAVAGLLRTADCVSNEKRDGTFGLLFLTNLRPRQVVLGKLFSSATLCYFIILGITPILAIPLLMGGVQLIEFGRMLLVLISTLFLSLALGLFVSTLSNQVLWVYTVSLMVMSGLVLGPLVLGNLVEHYLKSSYFGKLIEMLGPLHSFESSYSRSFIRNGNSYWISLLFTNLLALNFLWRTCGLAGKVWQDRPPAAAKVRWLERFRRFKFGRQKFRTKFRTRLLGRNPYFWRCSRERAASMGYQLIIFLFLTGAILIGVQIGKSSVAVGNSELQTIILFGCFLAALGLLQAMLFYKIATTACLPLGEDRRSGAMELLLSTPLTERQVLNGHYLAMFRQIAGPGLIILVIHFGVAAGILATYLSETNKGLPFVKGVLHLFQNWPAGPPGVGWEKALLLLLWVTAGFGWPILWTSLVIVSTWLGLLFRNVVIAAGLSLFLILVFPVVLFAFLSFALHEGGLRFSGDYMAPYFHGIFASLIMGGNSLFFSIVARKQITNKLRVIPGEWTEPFWTWKRVWPEIRRWSLRFGIFGILLVALYAEENWRGKRRFKQFETKLQSRGESLLRHPPARTLPEAVNFAHHPIFLTLRPVQGDWRWGAIPSGVSVGLQSITVGGSAQSPWWRYGNSGANLQAWIAGQGTDLKEWQSRQPPIGGLASNTIPAITILKTFSSYESDLTKLKEALKERPQGAFGTNGNTYQYYAHFALLENVAEVLSLKACAHLNVSETESALDALTYLFQLAQSLSEEISGEGRETYESMLLVGLQPIWEGLARHRWDSEQVQVLQGRLGGVQLWNTASGNLRRSMQYAVDQAGSHSSQKIRALIPRGWEMQNSIEIYHFYQDKMLPCLDVTNKLIHPLKVMESSLLLQRGGGSAFIDPFFKFTIAPGLGLGFQEAMKRFAFIQASIDQAQIALALEGYRMEKGNWPSQLSDMVPRYLSKMPHDLTSGKDFVYRTTSTGSFILYSPGWNGVDDNGTRGAPEQPYGWRSYLWSISNGDWVWSYP